MSVVAHGSAILPILTRETFDHARLVVPREKHLAFDTSPFALDLKSLFEVAADRNGEIEVADRTVGKLNVDIPAISAEPLEQSRVHARDGAAEPAGCIHKMAGMRED